MAYQWITYGTNIAGATNSAYIVQTNMANDGALFSVVVTNALGTNSAGPWTMRMLLPGMVAVWGEDSFGVCERPVSLTNAMAIAAGGQHAVAAGDNGVVWAWGANNFGQTNVPPGLSNVVAVAAGTNHSLALTAQGSVVAWGCNTNRQTNVPSAALSNVIAIAAAANQSLALKNNGTVVPWGQTNGTPPATLTNATAIAAGETFCLALTSNGTVVAWGQNASGQTNPPANLTNVVAIAAGGSHALALTASGTVVAWGANGSGQTTVPPGLSNVIAVAAGTAHSLARNNDGTTVAWGNNAFGQLNAQANTALVKLVAAGGNHSMVAAFSPLVQYPIDVTKDLLLVYNANSVDSSNVCAYYLANRPMVSGANVLALTSCTTDFSIARTNYTNSIKSPLANWLSANPTKRPQYMILFVDVPARINAQTTPYGVYDMEANLIDNSVSYEIYSTSVGIPPFITHINMRNPNGPPYDVGPCTNYISKLQYFATTYSPGKLVISAAAGSYAGTNYALDNGRDGVTYTNYPFLATDFSSASNILQTSMSNLVQSGTPPSAIIYSNGIDQVTNVIVSGTNEWVHYNGPHITSAANVTGYACWGAHSALGDGYPMRSSSDGSLLVTWQGASGWWLIDTFESFNGLPLGGQGNYWEWFYQFAFGSNNYENTPVGAITHTDEPYEINMNLPYPYLGLWASGKNFAICAWNTRRTPYFQAVGDPFITK